jgi:xanthine dehydrogenase accessory factor
MSRLYKEFTGCLKNEKLVALCTVIAGPGLGRKMLIQPDGQTRGDLGSAPLNRKAGRCADKVLHKQKPDRITVDLDQESVEVFVEVFPPPPKLIIIGAVHVAISLITFARVLGFHTVVVDPRSVFATPERFSHADELILQWPQEAFSPVDFNESTYLVVLSHDEKLDDLALKLALESRCRYIGALGSRKTQARRVASLKKMGVTDQQLARIHAPVGLDLGGRKPEEIAVSIIAQMVAVRNGADLKQD